MTEFVIRACFNAGLPAVMSFALAIIGILSLLVALQAMQTNRQTVEHAVRALQAHGRDDLVAELRAIQETARMLGERNREVA